MADNPVRLQAREVSYQYPDGTAALGQINLSIHDGEFIGLLGANGSGKTTLLKVLDGLIRDFKGTVTLDGSNIKTLTAKEIYGKMGMVFQNPDDQLFASTVFDDVAFGPINMGFPDREVKERVTSGHGRRGNGRVRQKIDPPLEFRTKKKDLHRRPAGHGASGPAAG